MAENKQQKLAGYLLAIGIVICILLTFLDLKIKNDLIRKAIELDNKIREYARAGTPDNVDNSDSAVSSSIPIHTENHHDTRLEVQSDSDEIPESEEVKIHRKGRNARDRFSAEG